MATRARAVRTGARSRFASPIRFANGAVLDTFLFEQRSTFRGPDGTKPVPNPAVACRPRVGARGRAGARTAARYQHWQLMPWPRAWPSKPGWRRLLPTPLPKRSGTTGSTSATHGG
jgi:hypothetical protein